MEKLKQEYLELVTKFRQDLHQIPEIGFDLFETSKYVKAQLEAFGYNPEVVAKTGLVAVKQGKSREAIAFRCDMDALRVDEKTNVTFKSTNVGKMHACGHDGHMALLLGFAKYIATLNPNKTIVLIFQPAEEGPGGAKEIIEAGIFTKYNIKSIFGLHLYPNIDENKFGILSGPALAQSGEFKVTVNGKSSHGAMPHQGMDAILAASQVVTNYHTIISRNIDPLNPAVLTVGKINGGEARNVIANQVVLEGTIRAFDPKIYQAIKTRMTEINHGVEIISNVKIDTEFIDYYPPVVNDDNLYHDVVQILGKDEYVKIKPMMISEDFAYYQQVVPGFFVMLGTRNEKDGYTYPLHNPCFNFNERVLLKGIELYIRICEYYKILP